MTMTNRVGRNGTVSIWKNCKTRDYSPGNRAQFVVYLLIALGPGSPASRHQPVCDTGPSRLVTRSVQLLFGLLGLRQLAVCAGGLRQLLQVAQQ